MRYLSVCSGIESASCAWQPLGWEPVGFAEVDRFCCRVLAHHYPDVTNYGDLTKHDEWDVPAIDVLVGGTPCQSFSVAGLRRGMADARGQLALEYFRLAARLRPRWIVWENVPGALSADGGSAFAAIIGALDELGYGYAWRVLDAQYFDLAQRRERVFVVGCLGDWRRAAAVLLEPASLRGDPAPSREAWEGVAADAAPSLTASGRGVARAGDSRGQDPVIAHALNARGGAGRFDAESETLLPIAFDAQGGGKQATLGSSEHHTGALWTTKAPAIAGTLRGHVRNNSNPASEAAMHIQSEMGVRRITPTEAERLQGFADGYTAIRGASDGARYRAIGNAIAVPVLRWIGRRMG